MTRGAKKIALGTLIGGLFLLAYFSIFKGEHQAASSGGRIVVTKIKDSGFLGSWASDFYVDMYLITDSGGRRKIWKDRLGQQSSKNAEFLKDTIKWVSEREIHFSSKTRRTDYILTESKNGDWNVVEKPDPNYYHDHIEPNHEESLESEHKP